MIKIDYESSSPIYQQVADQIHFAINTGVLKPGQALPSIRKLAASADLASNTIVKALKSLESSGLIEAKDRSGYKVSKTMTPNHLETQESSPASNRYQARGVSAEKTEVHSVVDKLDPGLFPGAFCKITEDYLSGDPAKCNIIHADGSGTKSVIAYLEYKESGDASVFEGIAQDSIVMNLDDLLCIGATGRILLSNTINRHASNCPGEVIKALIEGGEKFMQQLRDQGVQIYPGGGETADVGDLTGTVVVDSCAVSIARKSDIIENRIIPDLAIVGLASSGRSSYEQSENSGIGSNGLTSARHDMLSHYYAETYPESYDSSLPKNLTYCGPYKLDHALPGSEQTVGQALLSPTRSYAPVILELLNLMKHEINAIVHCSGGAQTKCLRFGEGIHFVKNNLMTVPAVFNAIQTASGTTMKEMYKVFNMGHRMELYVPHRRVQEVIDVATAFGINAQQIGHTEAARENHLSLVDHLGKTIHYP